MILLNERQRVKQAIEGIIAGYGPLRNPGGRCADESTKKRLSAIMALDKQTATAKQVKEIWGSDDWAGPVPCDECGEKSYELVLLGDPHEKSGFAARVCVNCLCKAALLALSEKEKAQE